MNHELFHAQLPAHAVTPERPDRHALASRAAAVRYRLRVRKPFVCTQLVLTSWQPRVQGPLSKRSLYAGFRLDPLGQRWR